MAHIACGHTLHAHRQETHGGIPDNEAAAEREPSRIILLVHAYVAFVGASHGTGYLDVTAHTKARVPVPVLQQKRYVTEHLLSRHCVDDIVFARRRLSRNEHAGVDKNAAYTVRQECNRC